MEKNIRNKIEKVVVSTGVGRFSQQSDFESKILPELMKEISIITGQKPQIIKSKIAVSGFKLRIGQTVGLKVTLRKNKAVDFLDRLINIVLPRIKDFRGLSPKSIDKSGVLNIGLKDKSIFPEIIPENSRINFGLEISIVPKYKNHERALELFKEIKTPIKHG